eukprot:13231466-Alexandrium_andersonii.AAC.2
MERSNSDGVVGMAHAVGAPRGLGVMRSFQAQQEDDLGPAPLEIVHDRRALLFEKLCWQRGPDLGTLR